MQKMHAAQLIAVTNNYLLSPLNLEKLSGDINHIQKRLIALSSVKFYLKKGSILYGILKFKCPRCHEGDLYTNKNPYNLRKLLVMNRKCSVCQQTFTPEPGFYFGAAYISYMFITLACVISFLLFFFAFKVKDVNSIIFLMIAFTVLLAPLNYRLSRSVWANIFIRYKGLPNKS